jgi:hypothetical protein
MDSAAVGPVNLGFTAAPLALHLGRLPFELLPFSAAGTDGVGGWGRRAAKGGAHHTGPVDHAPMFRGILAYLDIHSTDPNGVFVHLDHDHLPIGGLFEYWIPGTTPQEIRGSVGCSSPAQVSHRATRIALPG